jgi:hypothetical protein
MFSPSDRFAFPPPKGPGSDCSPFTPALIASVYATLSSPPAALFQVAPIATWFWMTAGARILKKVWSAGIGCPEWL